MYVLYICVTLTGGQPQQCTPDFNTPFASKAECTAALPSMLDVKRRENKGLRVVGRCRAYE